MNILVYGYGNPGRSDDGLGIEFTQRFESLTKNKKEVHWSFDSNYQLNIEDADALAGNDIVIFADASEEEIDDFCISLVDAKSEMSFTTHAASPGYIVHLCEKLFNKRPVVYLLHIKGYDWEFKEGLSEKAVQNLQKALDYMSPVLGKPERFFEIKTFETKLCSKNL